MTAEKLDVLRAPILETQQSLPWSWGHTLGERIITRQLGFPGWLSSKESACSAGDPGSTPEWGRSPGGGNSNPLQSSCLENPMDRGAWWATVRGVARVRQGRASPRASGCVFLDKEGRLFKGCWWALCVADLGSGGDPHGKGQRPLFPVCP